MPKAHDDPDHECRCTAMQTAKAWCLVIAAVGGLMTSTVAAVFSGLNNRKAEVIETRQMENSAKIDDAAAKAVEVKDALRETTAKTQQKLGSIEAEVKKGK